MRAKNSITLRIAVTSALLILLVPDFAGTAQAQLDLPPPSSTPLLEPTQAPTPPAPVAEAIEGSPSRTNWTASLTPPVLTSTGDPVALSVTLVPVANGTGPTPVDIVAIRDAGIEVLSSQATPRLDAGEPWRYDFLMDPDVGLTRIQVRLAAPAGVNLSDASPILAQTWVLRSFPAPVDVETPALQEESRILVDKEWADSRYGLPALHDSFYSLEWRGTRPYYSFAGASLADAVSLGRFEPSLDATMYGRGSPDSIVFADRPMRVRLLDVPRWTNSTTPDGARNWSERLLIDFDDGNTHGQPVWFNASWLDDQGLPYPSFAYVDGTPIPARRHGDYWLVEPPHFSVINVTSAGANAFQILKDEPYSGIGLHPWGVAIGSDRRDHADISAVMDFVPHEAFTLRARLDIDVKGEGQAAYPLGFGNRTERANPVPTDHDVVRRALGFHYRSNGANVRPEVEAFYAGDDGVKHTVWTWSTADDPTQALGSLDGLGLQIRKAENETYFELTDSGGNLDRSVAVSNNLLPWVYVDVIFAATEEGALASASPSTQLTVRDVTVELVKGNFLHEDFANSPVAWQLSAHALHVPTEGILRLVDSVPRQAGLAAFETPMSSPRFSVEFRYRYDPPNYGDGLAFLVYKNLNYAPAYGQKMGLEDTQTNTNFGHEGYAFALPNFAYACRDGDSIALMKHTNCNVVAHTERPQPIGDDSLGDDSWHRVHVVASGDRYNVYYDGVLALRGTHKFDRTHSGFGFSAANDLFSANHDLDYVYASVADALAKVDHAPYVPETPSPPLNATVQVPPGSVTVSWRGGDIDGDALTYEVLADEFDPPTTVRCVTQNLFCVLPGMQANRTYHWRVNSSDGGNGSNGDLNLGTNGPVWTFATTYGGGPLPPSAPSPLDGAVLQPLALTLAWTTASTNGAPVRNTVYFGTTEPPTAIICENITGTSCPVGPLSPATTYYWQVKSSNDGGSRMGPVWHFRTNIPPNVPSAPSPPNGATGQPIKMVLTWQGGDPDGTLPEYKVWFGAAGATKDVVCSWSTVAACTLPQLSYNTAYEWWVQASDGTTNAYGPQWSFRTDVNRAPQIPSNPFPPTGTTNLTVAGLTLIWAGGDSNGPEPKYTVEYSFDKSLTGNDFWRTWCTDVVAPTCRVDPIRENTTFKWRVTAKDGQFTVRGPEWTFKTSFNRPSFVASEPVPAEGATEQNLTVRLDWVGGDPDGSWPLYDVYVDTRSPPGTLRCSELISASCVLTGLQYNTTYYWRVSPSDGMWRLPGLVWTFTTGPSPVPHPPLVPYDPSPPDGSTLTRGNVSLQWSGGDPDGGQITYTVYTAPERFGIPEILCVNVRTPNCTLQNLTTLGGAAVFWWVVASDGETATESPHWSLGVPPVALGGGGPLEYECESDIFGGWATASLPTGQLPEDCIFLGWGCGIGIMDCSLDQLGFGVFAYIPHDPIPFPEQRDVPPIRTILEWEGENPAGRPYDVLLAKEAPGNVYEGAEPNAYETVCTAIAHAQCILPHDLEWGTTYVWQIVPHGQPSAPRGPVWRFTTSQCIDRWCPTAEQREYMKDATMSTSASESLEDSLGQFETGAGVPMTSPVSELFGDAQLQGNLSCDSSLTQPRTACTAVFLHGFGVPDTGSARDWAATLLDAPSHEGPRENSMADWLVDDYFLAHGYAKVANLGYHGGDCGSTSLPGRPHAHYRAFPSGHADDHLASRVPGCNGEPLEHTLDTDIRHLAYHVAWDLYDAYTDPDGDPATEDGESVDVIAHGLGGIVLRTALQFVADGDVDFPPNLLVEDVVTFGAPHQGTIAGCYQRLHDHAESWDLQISHGVLQGDQLCPDSGFLNWLNTKAQNPGDSDGTDWSLVGSTGRSLYDVDDEPASGDFVVPKTSATGMAAASLKFVYGQPAYRHTEFVSDSVDASDARVDWWAAPGAAAQPFVDEAAWHFPVLAFNLASLPSAPNPYDLCPGEVQIDCPLPDLRPPRPPYDPSRMRHFESTANDSAPLVSHHDWDADGILDGLDVVNLPSEARLNTTAQDYLAMAPGLVASGFVLLVEPGHRQAQLVVADVDQLVEGPRVVNGSQALDLLGVHPTTEGGRALAFLLHTDMVVQYTPIAPQTPLNLSLAWPLGAAPADGTWLLGRSQPTLLVQLRLAGQSVALPPAAASEYALAGEWDYRWEFLNLHEETTVCYDSTTLLGVPSCPGSTVTDWMRAYSGQAAYALEALHGGLERGFFRNETQDLANLPSRVASSLLDSAAEGPSGVFDGASPWSLLGTSSRQFPVGLGINYWLPSPTGAPGLFIQQGDDALQSTRRFVFQVEFYSTPTDPRNLTHFHLGIEPADGNHSAQTFVLDGKLLDLWLDVRPGETVQASADDEHKDGFASHLADVNGDGVEDLVIFVPHFGPTWIEVRNPGAYENFWKVATPGTGQGWITGGMGTVHWFGNGGLRRQTISGGVGPNQRTLGLFVQSSSNAWVTGAGDGTNRPFIARYVAASDSWSATFVDGTSPDEALNAVWMRNDGQLGYAGGSQGLWVRYTSAEGWKTLPRPTRCSIMDIDFGNDGKGSIAVATNADGSCASNGGPDGAIMFWDGTKITAASDPSVKQVNDLYWAWASGFIPRAPNGSPRGPGVYWFKENPWRWEHATGLSPRDTFGLAVVPGTTHVHMAGRGENNRDSAVTSYNGQWSTRTLVAGGHPLNGISFASERFGLVVGSNVVFQYVSNQNPKAVGQLNTKNGDTMTVFTADASASRDPDGDPLTYDWSWGDGATSQGFSASHRYDSAGPFPVTLLVSDGQGGSGRWEDTVTVSPVPVAESSWVGGAFSNGGEYQRHHYELPASGSERWIQLEVQGSGLSILGQLNGSPSQAGSWPKMGSQGTSLVGQVPAGQRLLFAVDHPAGAATSYQVRALRLARDPTLPPPSQFTPVEMSSRTVTYLEPVKFSIVYKDPSGNPPSQAPTVTVNGQTYTLNLPTDCTPDFVAGVTYSYVVARLPGGRAHVPVFHTVSYLQETYTATGGSIFVQAAYLAFDQFESSTLGGAAKGYALGDEPLNYWHVVDTRDSAMPNRVAWGEHGKAVWFGHESTGTYQDPNGGTPRGTLTSPVHDLRMIQRPRLSFLSFYETQDLGASRDVKRVEVHSRSPGGEWTAWTTAHVVSGEAGGYGAWRTQVVDLAPWAIREIQFRFVFDAVDNKHNDYLGWLIDDVVVGHDADKDALPDPLEESRRDIRVSNQPIPVVIGDGATGRSYVRRLNRPNADQFVLDAMVDHPNPDAMRILLGVTTPAQPDQTVVLYDRGSTPGLCSYGGIHGYTGGWGTYAPVRKRNDGVELHIDLKSCGFASLLLFTSPDWFLEVQDTSADGRMPTISFLRITSSGRTNAAVLDTDTDGRDDGVELTSVDSRIRGDPLGFDVDEDGIPEGLDPDDERPNWSPAVRITGHDFQRQLVIQFDDLKLPLASVRFTEGYNGGGSDEIEIRPTYMGGAAWSVPTRSPTPDYVRIWWTDVYDNRGTLVLEMGRSDAGRYQPVAASATYESFRVQSVNNVPRFPIDTTTAITVLVVGAVFLPASGTALVGAGVALAGLFALTYAVDTWENRKEAQNAEAEWVTTCGGGRILLRRTLVGDAGFAAAKAALQGCKFADVPGGRRFFDDAGNGLTVVLVRGRAAFEAWRWILPPVGYGIVGSVESFLKAERQVAKGVKQANENDLKYEPAARSVVKKDCGIGLIVMTASGDGVPIVQQTTTRQVNTCLLQALVTARDWAERIGDVFHVKTEHAGMGGMGLGAELMLAQSEEAFSSGDALEWYWGKPNSVQPCGPPETDPRRRCSPEFDARPWDQGVPLDEGPNAVAYKVEWKNHKKDALSAMGFIPGMDDIGLSSGRVVLDEFKKQLEAYTAQLDMSGMDARVRVAYDLGSTKPADPSLLLVDVNHTRGPVCP